MEETSREKWLQVLESLASSRPDQVEQEWAWLLQRLGLGPEYFLAVHEVIQQGRWRTCDNPAGYIKAAAWREDRRSLERALGDGNELTAGGLYSRSEGSIEDFLDNMEYRQDRRQPTREKDGVWRSAPGWSASYDGPQKKNSAHARFSPPRPQDGKLPPGPLDRYLNHPRLRHLREEMVQSISQLTPEDARQAPTLEIKPHEPTPHEITSHEIGSAASPESAAVPERLPDWPAWSRAAGLSDWEKKVVEYKMSGISRDEALAAQPDEPSRKALQAAWKKLSRTGLQRLRQAAPQTGGPRPAEDSEDEK